MEMQGNLTEERFWGSNRPKEEENSGERAVGGSAGGHFLLGEQGFERIQGYAFLNETAYGWKLGFLSVGVNTDRNHTQKSFM